MDGRVDGGLSGNVPYGLDGYADDRIADGPG